MMNNFYPHLPTNILNYYYRGHDKCCECGIFGRVYGKDESEFLCETDFENKYLSEYIDKIKQNIIKEKEKSLEEKFEKKILNRLEKRRCPIRLRE